MDWAELGRNRRKNYYEMSDDETVMRIVLLCFFFLNFDFLPTFSYCIALPPPSHPHTHQYTHTHIYIQILELCRGDQLTLVQDDLFKLLAACLASPHFQVITS